MYMIKNREFCLFFSVSILPSTVIFIPLFFLSSYFYLFIHSTLFLSLFFPASSLLQLKTNYSTVHEVVESEGVRIFDKQSLLK